jgi:3-oxoadipate enol-lactonase
MMVRDGGPGRGPAVLLLHGWTATADVNFFAAYGPLAQDRRVVALDHRGHGRGIRAGTFSLEDCADDAAGLLDELGVARAVVVGYSMGGPVAMLLARRHPQKVSGLVVQATALEWSGEWSERLRWRGLALLELSLRMGSGESFVTRLLEDAVRRNPAVAPIRSWLAGEFRRGDPGSIADAGRAMSTYDARGWVRSLDLPAAAVVTTGDDLVPPAKQRALAEALSARVFELVAGHDAPVVAGEAFARATCEAVAWVEHAVEGRLGAHSAAR